MFKTTKREICFKIMKEQEKQHNQTLNLYWLLGHEEDYLINKLYALGFGFCSECNNILKIGRGENFSYCEEIKKEICNECFKKYKESDL